ncbi:MAG: elongation factor P [Candidatus Marinimicrobia bacterium]|jgi:elongation factor P|nr:elongation factor P [Candidatus Neomarinimicrobiota bacterium]MBT3633376.1 elongation factor P [Candidatus Neomarinimicrobiota bacterium]MBT3681519.1 elongation factor P [Candidatus Neomarinimicrobiota bacterium]MBT3758514.1 elongation factor P [Candidatus Neomarinimicrobiota bacterium]MBT3894832.1 elongation factor P [Candidatus Neomarinimicrobiota bacterium]
MASTSDFRNGVIIVKKGNLWKIVEFLHVKPGKGPAFVRTKLKNVKTGQVVDETFRAGEKIETVRLEARNYNYMYNDGQFYYFMDTETYDQIQLLEEQISDILDFLIENTPTVIAFNGSDPVEVRIPQHMEMTIKETDPGEKGNTAQGGTKPAVLETGVTIQVPLFIQEGEKIRVDTKDRRYIERVKS